MTQLSYAALTPAAKVFTKTKPLLALVTTSGLPPAAPAVNSPWEAPPGAVLELVPLGSVAEKLSAGTKSESVRP
jgi:hypothetical protein